MSNIFHHCVECSASQGEEEAERAGEGKEVSGNGTQSCFVVSIGHI